MKKLLSLLSALTIISLTAHTPDEHEFDKNPYKIEYSYDPSYNHQPKKNHTILIYMAADNDLFYFVKRNLDDMKKIGSNKHLNIVVHLDPEGLNGKTKRLYVGHNRIYQTNMYDFSAHEKQDSGSAQTLIEFCTWGIQNYPADNYTLVLWNHGAGILDNFGGKLNSATELFTYNPHTHKLDLDRSIPFLKYAIQKEHRRAVCFSDTYGTFLSNQRLENALKKICPLLPKKKFDIIGFDACLMGMIEIAHLLTPYAHFLVGSEEVELGTGWPYNFVLEPFLNGAPSAKDFASHIVKSFERLYIAITDDYTLSAIDLTKINTLCTALDDVSNSLLDALYYQEGLSVYKALKLCRSRKNCIHFSEPSYIDLHNFLKNIAQLAPEFKLTAYNDEIKSKLSHQIQIALQAISGCVVNNVMGKNLANAKGLAIYFPLYRIDNTYFLTPFAQHHKWVSLLNEAL